MVVVVAVDDARVVLAQQGAAVVMEIGFQVDAEVGVGIASRISFFHCVLSFAREVFEKGPYTLRCSI